MKKWITFLILLVPGLAFAVNDDNRPLGATPVRTNTQTKDDGFLIRFSTTISQAQVGTGILLLATHTAQDVSWPGNISFSTQPAKTNGGRSFFAFQVINSSKPVFFDFVSAPTRSTSPFVSNGSWFPPADFPVGVQSPLYIMADSTATISGWIWTEKSRR